MYSIQQDESPVQATGEDLGETYKNDQACVALVDFIAQGLQC